MKLPVPQPGSSTVALPGTPRRARAVVHGRDDGRRGVEGVEGGALGAGVFLGREQRLQLLAEGLPGGVLVAAGDRVGEDRQGDGAESAEAGQRLPLLWRGGPLFLLDALEGADGGEDVAGFRLLAAGDRRALPWKIRKCRWATANVTVLAKAAWRVCSCDGGSCSVITS